MQVRWMRKRPGFIVRTISFTNNFIQLFHQHIHSVKNWSIEMLNQRIGLRSRIGHIGIRQCP